MKRVITTAFLALSLAGPSSAFAQDEEEEYGPEEAAAAAAPQAKSPAAKKQAMSKLMSILKKEPDVRQVQKWAVNNYKLETDRINGMATRAHAKALIPEIEASVDNMVGNNFSNTRDGLFPILPNPPANPNPQSFKERVAGSQDSTTYRLRAVWSLDRLIFNAEALDAKSLTSLQENLVREVTTMFFSRRRVLASLILNGPEDPEEFFYEILRLEEMTATLDAFTGGKFAKRSWKWDDPTWHKSARVIKKKVKLPGLAGLR